jgi:hypothetical protein
LKKIPRLRRRAARERKILRDYPTMLPRAESVSRRNI